MLGIGKPGLFKVIPTTSATALMSLKYTFGSHGDWEYSGIKDPVVLTVSRTFQRLPT